MCACGVCCEYVGRVVNVLEGEEEVLEILCLVIFRNFAPSSSQRNRFINGRLRELVNFMGCARQPISHLSARLTINLKYRATCASTPPQQSPTKEGLKLTGLFVNQRRRKKKPFLAEPIPDHKIPQFLLPLSVQCVTKRPPLEEKQYKETTYSSVAYFGKVYKR